MMLVATSNLTGVDPQTDIEQRTALNALFKEVILPALTDVELRQ